MDQIISELHGQVHVIGAGLAGTEAAWQCLKLGARVVLHEMRPKKITPAHKTGDFAELVCSNSLRSTSLSSAAGELKYEMNLFDSLILKAAEHARIPAGGALAVDRKVFSAFITESLFGHKNFLSICEEVSKIPEGCVCIIATGPLTSDSMLDELKKLCGSERQLYFYDAVAPLIEANSIDFEKCFKANRYDDSSDDYLNIPLNKDQYESLVAEIVAAQKVPLHSFESPKYFESCLPIEVMAERGLETLRFGPMKPMGLVDPKTGRRPWANVQLRKENKEETMYSMVGFQTKMTCPEQKRVLSMLPGLENADFLRYGSVHRNTYLNSPEILDPDLSFKNSPRVFLAGQITGVEGYVESAAIGILAARAACSKLFDRKFYAPPRDTLMGALLHHVTAKTHGPFQPMNANIGLLPPLPKEKNVGKKDRHQKQCDAARELFLYYLKAMPVEASPSQFPALHESD